MEDLKLKLTNSFSRILSSIDEFNFIMDHQEFHLDNFISKIKNEIDIQREELIEKIHKASNEMIKRLDYYYDECKENFKNLNELTSDNKTNLIKLKDELIRKQTNIDNLDETNLQSIVLENELCLRKNKMNIEAYETKLKMNKYIIFDPIHFANFKDLFGKLLIEEIHFNSNDKTGKIIKSFFHDCYDSYSCMELIENNKIAIGNKKGKIKIFDSNKSECILILDGHSGLVSSLKAISKNILASASVDCLIKIWNLDKGQCIKTLTEHERRVTCFWLDSVNRFLISGSLDRTIKIWDLNKDYECIQTLIGHKECVKCIETNSRNQLISASDDKTIRIWSLSNFSCDKTIEIDDTYITVISIQINKDDNILSLFNDTVKLWDSITGDCIRNFKIFDNIYIDVCFLKLFKNEYFISIENISYGIFQFKLKVWSIYDQNRCLHEMHYNGNVLDLSVLNNGSIIFLNENMDIANKYFHSIKVLNMIS